MKTTEQLAEEESGLQDIVDEIWDNPSGATAAAAELLVQQHQTTKRVRAELARLSNALAYSTLTLGEEAVLKTAFERLERALEGE